MSSRLTVSLVTASVLASLVSPAVADRAAEPGNPAAGAPVMRRAPMADPVAPAGSPGDIGTVPVDHYARPPHGGRHQEEPAMDREQLRVVLRAARAKNLAAFRAYAAAGVYPSNTYNNGSLNVWRDRDGHLCAAATIIYKSGATDLVDRVADQNNFIKLADVKQGPLEDWILTSGLTQEEIVLIQKPFMGVSKSPKPMPTTVDPFADGPSIEPTARQSETARLKKLYRTVDAQLARDEAKSLDLAAARLLKHPTLAWHALGYTGES